MFLITIHLFQELEQCSQEFQADRFLFTICMFLFTMPTGSLHTLINIRFSELMSLRKITLTQQNAFFELNHSSLLTHFHEDEEK